MSIANEISRIKAAKESLKDAINARGGSLSNELLDEYAAAVSGLPAGGNNIDLTGVTVTADKMLEGIVAVDRTGSKVTGTIETVTAIKSGDMVTVPVGYIAKEQTFEVGSTETPVDLSFVTAGASDILSGKVGADKDGNPVNGTIQTVVATMTDNVVTVPQGHIATEQTLTVAEASEPSVSDNVVTIGKGYNKAEKTVTIPEMEVANDGEKVIVPVGYNKIQREFELNTGETVEYGYIDENGEFQPVDLSGETPVISGNPVNMENTGIFDIPADEADYTAEWEKPFNGLTLTANEPNSTVKLTTVGVLNGGVVYISGIMYRTNSNSDFVKYEIDQTITLAKAGDYVQFWNTREELASSYMRVGFKMTGSISASGNIQSMLNFSEKTKQYCYWSLFADCSSLTQAPQLPATELTDGCYYKMFSGCTSLTNAPELPATTLADNCYYSMFSGCTSLTNAPELPATTMERYCYNTMFNGCINLKSIKVRFTIWNGGIDGIPYTQSWLYKVSSTGTFYKPSALEDKRGSDYIPSGWTVVNID